MAENRPKCPPYISSPYHLIKGCVGMVQPREARVATWGTSLGIRIPKEFATVLDVEDRSKVQLEIKNGVLQIVPIVERRKRKPLEQILSTISESGAWDGAPAEITTEDREWLDSPSIGAEAVQYD